MPINCGTCAALGQSECVCDGATRMVLAPRPPVSNVWPHDLFPERPEDRRRRARTGATAPAEFREQD